MIINGLNSTKTRKIAFRGLIIFSFLAFSSQNSFAEIRSLDTANSAVESIAVGGKKDKKGKKKGKSKKGKGPNCGAYG